MSSSGLDDFYRWTVPTPTKSVATSPVPGPLLRRAADLASQVCSAAAAGSATSIEYVATTERRGTQALNTEDGNANTAVWVIEMRGSFTVPRPGPGGTAPHGAVATTTYDRRTHVVIGDGIANQIPRPSHARTGRHTDLLTASRTSLTCNPARFAADSVRITGALPVRTPSRRWRER